MNSSFLSTFLATNGKGKKSRNRKSERRNWESGINQRRERGRPGEGVEGKMKNSKLKMRTEDGSWLAIARDETTKPEEFF
ncbi:MAG TPA: hypothetical protein VNN22_18655 [Verrucomicrobiae bacterium]|nr:hypothetical protein [Verrucomicrobiae bacterium]